MAQQLMEQFYPPIQSDGLNTNTNTTLGGTLSVTGATTFASTVVGQRSNVVSETTNATLTTAQSGSVILFNTITGATLTLPTAASGLNYKFVVVKAPASGTHTIVTASGSEFLIGGVTVTPAAGTVATFLANGTSHVRIGMNGSTTGGSLPTAIYVTAISATQWEISGTSFGSGALATPFTT